MMTCEKVKKLLADYSVGALSQNRRIKIETHLNACPDCQKELRALKRVDELLNLIPLESTSDARLCWNTIKAKISQQPIGNSSGWNMSNWLKISPALSFASALLLLLAVGTSLFVLTNLTNLTNLSAVLNTTATAPMLGVSVVESHLYASWHEPFVLRGHLATEIEVLNRETRETAE